ncbi:MAG: GntR family transcriptional regulator [Limnohabitans sp.]
MDRQPLYSRIADQLAKDIAKGRYPVGTTLPAEPDLAVLLKVSRSTVRAALASLENRKLVSRKKNAGTRVEALSPQGGYGATLTSLSDLIQWAQACERSVQHTSRIVMDQALAKELGCPAGSPWLCVQSLRFDATRGKLPVSWTYAYIDAKYASVLETIQAHPSALMSELLETEFGLDLATVEQDVTGCKLDAPLAKNLKADEDEAALQVIRRYLTRDQQPVLVTVSIHPAKRFSIRTTLTRN